MSKSIGFYNIPSGIDEDVKNIIIKQLNKSILQESQIINFDNFDNNNLKLLRNSKICWIDTDNWISGMMSHFVNCSNVNYFKYDLTQWESKIQYTVYDGAGSRYNWHVDTVESFDSAYQRKLSVSLCLSSTDEYEGGEFQIKIGREIFTKKMNCGDVLIFPSDCYHRVKQLKSGKRISLVGWYGGPKFK